MVSSNQPWQNLAAIWVTLILVVSGPVVATPPLALAVDACIVSLSRPILFSWGLRDEEPVQQIDPAIIDSPDFSLFHDFANSLVENQVAVIRLGLLSSLNFVVTRGQIYSVTIKNPNGMFRKIFAKLGWAQKKPLFVTDVSKLEGDSPELYLDYRMRSWTKTIFGDPDPILTSIGLALMPLRALYTVAFRNRPQVTGAIVTLDPETIAGFTEKLNSKGHEGFEIPLDIQNRLKSNNLILIGSNAGVRLDQGIGAVIGSLELLALLLALTH